MLNNLAVMRFHFQLIKRATQQLSVLCVMFFFSKFLCNSFSISYFLQARDTNYHKIQYFILTQQREKKHMLQTNI
jgi:lipid-A-disaccharide synthase-like uncharacterized protein